MGRKRDEEEDRAIADEIERQAAKDRIWKKLRKDHPELPEDYSSDPDKRRGKGK